MLCVKSILAFHAIWLVMLQCQWMGHHTQAKLPQMHTQLMLLKLKVGEMYTPLGDTAGSQLTGYGEPYISQV